MKKMQKALAYGIVHNLAIRCRMLDNAFYRLVGIDIAHFSIVALICCFLLVTIFIVFLRLTTKPYAEVKRYESETAFKNPITGGVVQFPSLFDDPKLELSVIVPAYNEAKRLPKMLDECIAYLDRRAETSASRFRYEIIVVDDGSRDGTSKLALAYSKEYTPDKIRVLTLQKNRGKGGAVRLGVLSARGKFILFADADGATKFSDLERLEQAGLIDPNLKIEYDKPYVVCGSRAHLEKDSIASRSLFRTFLMKAFHVFVFAFGDKDIKDTQCGFKLFTRRAAQLIFPALHVERWAFDVEVLKVARMHRIPVREIPVHWTEIDGSHIVPVFSWLQIAKDLFVIWFKYAFGIWRVSTMPQKNSAGAAATTAVVSSSSSSSTSTRPLSADNSVFRRHGDEDKFAGGDAETDGIAVRSRLNRPIIRRPVSDAVVDSASSGSNGQNSFRLDRSERILRQNR